jgi:hypothetical protein
MGRIFHLPTNFSRTSFISFNAMNACSWRPLHFASINIIFSLSLPALSFLFNVFPSVLLQRISNRPSIHLLARAMATARNICAVTIATGCPAPPRHRRIIRTANIMSTSLP